MLSGIVANWLIEADFRYYFKRLKNGYTVWLLLGILFLGLLSLMWSDNVDYGLHDIARKMPFFAIPFALGLGKPVEKKIQYFLLYVFIGILLLTSGINYYRYNFVLDDPGDLRKMSFFISHVRFSIVTGLGIFAALYLIVKRKGPAWLWAIAILWLFFYSLKSQVLTGYFVLLVLGIYSTVYLIKKLPKMQWKIAASCLVLIAGVTIAMLLNKTFDDYAAPAEIDLTNLEENTPSGRPYYHALDRTQRENGNLVWLYVQQEELESEWNRRSDIPYDSLDRKGQPMFGTLMRYMSSKDLRKDSVGIWTLTEDEVRIIENGSTSIASNSGFKAKLFEFLHQWHIYQSGGDPNGHSLLQRVEHQHTAWSIVKREWLFGVGMGDVPQVFDEEYDRNGSLLTEENRHRSHNQFLTIWISHGLLGLLMLTGMLFIPLFKRKKIDYFHMVVFLTLFVSCLFQDILETQAGVTIFGLFYGITVYKEDEGDLEIEK